MARDVFKYFRVEARELAEQLSRGIVALEGTSNPGNVTALLRYAHTLKGAAHVVKQSRIAQLAHELEDSLAPLTSADVISADKARTMLRQVDEISACITNLDSEGHAKQEQKPAESAVAAPAAMLVDDVFDTVRVDIGDMDLLLNGIAESALQVAGFKSKLAAVEHAADLGAILISQLHARRATDTADRANAALSKARAIAEDLTNILKPLRSTLTSGLEQVESELGQVRDTASQMRLLPVSAVFGTLQRAVRNSAETLGKRIEFETFGGNHRLDAHVLAAVRDALLHVVRNAVAHGIESRSERIAARKEPIGKIALTVQRHGNRLAFACHDDGRGFDVVALRRAVVSSGLLSESEAAAMDVNDLLNARVGALSTVRKIDEISGRGIGLDVVRDTAAKLKAEVTIHTEHGQGATVQISVPVSLLSMPAVIVDSNGVSASLPLDSVKQTLRLSENDIVHNPDGDAVVFEGKTIPYLLLARAIGQQLPPQGNRRHISSAVVLRSGTGLAALGVDRLMGTATILLRPIPSFAEVDPVVAGAALDAEGNPQLVLDPAALIMAARSFKSMERPAPPRTPVFLVVDDSLTTRMLEKSILESAGYQVDLATSAEEALEKGLACRYDMFVVDVEMPGMNGFEFVAKTQEHPALRDIPSILVTSRNSAEDKKRGEEVGARAYIVKGEFDQGHLLHLIRQLVS